MVTEHGVQLVDYLRRNVAEGMLVLDRGGQITAANRAAETILGYGPGQLTSLFFSDLWWSRPLQLLPRSHRVDAEFVRQDGEPVPVSVAISPLEGSQDGEQLVSLVGRGEVDELNETLLHVQRLAGVGTLTASVAHELTNPISIITAACTNLKEEIEAGDLTREQLDRYIELIEQSAFRSARIVDVLRRYSHNEGDGLNLAITSPADLIQDALTMVEQQFRKRAKVTVETEVLPGVQTIVCDHNRIVQVLVNLLLNARDAMQPDGGTIRVRFWSLGPLMTLRSDDGNGSGSRDYFAFSVSDTGTGIDPAIADRLTEPFFTTKPRGKGTGLGLFIAKGIVDQHQGRLTVENNPGPGATFTVVLPKRQ